MIEHTIHFEWSVLRVARFLGLDLASVKKRLRRLDCLAIHELISQLQNPKRTGSEFTLSFLPTASTMRPILPKPHSPIYGHTTHPLQTNTLTPHCFFRRCTMELRSTMSSTRRIPGHRVNGQLSKALLSAAGKQNGIDNSHACRLRPAKAVQSLMPEIGSPPLPLPQALPAICKTNLVPFSDTSLQSIALQQKPSRAARAGERDLLSFC